MNRMYGLPSCTTVRKARHFMDEAGHEYDFFSYAKVDDLSAAIAHWVQSAGLETVLNTRSVAFRGLPDADKERAQSDTDFAVALMATEPRLIKRPVLDTGSSVLTGFDEAVWRAAL